MPETTNVAQPLERLTHPCVTGLVRGSRSAHARCTNRDCECFCHRSRSFRDDNRR